MSPFEIGGLSVLIIIVLIYLGVYIPVALGAVSFVFVWLLRDDFELALNLLRLSVGDTVTEYTFATVPLFTFMGLIVARAGLGADIYEVLNSGFRRIKGGLGMATVGANAVFAAVTGSSVASAAVFSKISVPQMLHHGYGSRFAVGVVAGSSVLGMIIPPSAMLIIYAFIAEQSVGDMFLAGVIPGILLAFTFIGLIWVMGHLAPAYVGGKRAMDHVPLPWNQVAAKTLPIAALIVLVLGGIYTGWMTAVEAGAVGAVAGLIIAIIRRRLSAKVLWEVSLETGYITASILFLIIGASIYSRMLGMAGLPNELETMIATADLTFWKVMLVYVVLLVFLGTLLDTSSIILILAPLFLPVIEVLELSLVWFGIVTVIGAEIGLLTPPLGISCFVIKSTLNDDRVTLKDVFIGALPFAGVMLLVLLLLIQFPVISLGILD